MLSSLSPCSPSNHDKTSLQRHQERSNAQMPSTERPTMRKRKNASRSQSASRSLDQPGEQPDAALSCPRPDLEIVPRAASLEEKSCWNPMFNPSEAEPPARRKELLNRKCARPRPYRRPQASLDGESPELGSTGLPSLMGKAPAPGPCPDVGKRQRAKSSPAVASKLVPLRGAACTATWQDIRAASHKLEI